MPDRCADRRETPDYIVDSFRRNVPQGKFGYGRAKQRLTSSTIASFWIWLRRIQVLPLHAAPPRREKLGCRFPVHCFTSSRPAFVSESQFGCKGFPKIQY